MSDSSDTGDESQSSWPAGWPETWAEALAWIYGFSDTERTGTGTATPTIDRPHGLNA